MNERIRELLERMSALERELATELQQQGERLHYRVEGKRVEFAQAVAEAQRRARMGLGRWLARSRPQNFLTVPFIYGMVVPLLVLDLSVCLYQLICFPLYGIARVRRADYLVIDRHRLPYLNAIEKLHCAYCSYANGLLAFVREVTACTEQYWCPIKHSRAPIGPHGRYSAFLDYGDPEDYHARLERLRAELEPKDGA